MARNLFKAELGFAIRDTNTDTGTDILQGAGAPPGTSGVTDDAAIGSLWMDRTNGILYEKKTNTSSATDWKRLVDESIYTALGISYGDTDMGTYTGNVITDNGDQAAINQELSDAIEAGNFTASVAVPAATPTSIGAVLVDEFNYIEYEVWVYENAAEATKKEGFKFTILHNGTASADASSIDDTLHTKLKIGNVAGLTVAAVLSGTGAAQSVAMQITTTNASTVKVRRTAIPV